MTREEFRILYTYNDWANDRLTAMLYQAFGEETDLRAAEDPRIRALQEATVHIIGAQAVWRHRWQGHSPSSLLDPAEYPTPLAIRMAFGAERARFWGYFETLTEDYALEQEIPFMDLRGNPYTMQLWQMMQHVVTHSVYHRGQVTGRLIDLGFEEAIVSTDLITYYREAGKEKS